MIDMPLIWDLSKIQVMGILNCTPDSFSDGGLYLSLETALSHVDQMVKAGANINSYTYVKSIAEELRGLAVEFGVPIVSATQTTRSGFTSSDPGLEDTSESFGLPATADLMFALISSEELEALGQIMVKQLKNRYSDPTAHKRFVLGVDRAKMKLYDVEQDAQSGLADAGKQDKPINTFGNRDKPQNKFGGFKV